VELTAPEFEAQPGASLSSGVKVTLVIIALVALAIIAFCATRFDAHTVVVVAIAMALVAFFSGAAVTLGVYTKRLERRGGNEASVDEVETIRQDE
jgi:hypothetical protein